jgi:hypothetical protein
VPREHVADASDVAARVASHGRSSPVKRVRKCR